MKRETLHHPKTYALMAELGCDRPTALGYLTLLWDYTGQVSPQGDIGKWPNGVIARACDWNGNDPDTFLGALIRTGWIDQVDEPKVRLLIHDWPEHCERWIKGKLSRMGKGVHPLYSEPDRIIDVHTERTIDTDSVNTTDASNSPANSAGSPQEPEQESIAPNQTTGAHSEPTTGTHGLRPSPSLAKPSQTQPALGMGSTQTTPARASAEEPAAAFSDEKEQNQQQNGNASTPQTPLKKLLQFRGIPEPEARQLIERYGAQAVTACMRMMDVRKEQGATIKDPFAYLDKLLTTGAWKQHEPPKEGFRPKPTHKPLPPEEQCASKEEASKAVKEAIANLKAKGFTGSKGKEKNHETEPE